jgi:hypothetical protein
VGAAEQQRPGEQLVGARDLLRRRADPGDLVGHEGTGEGVSTNAAVLFRDHDGVQLCLDQSFEALVWKPRPLVDVRGMACDPVLGDGAGESPDLCTVVGQDCHGPLLRLDLAVDIGDALCGPGWSRVPTLRDPGYTGNLRVSESRIFRD